MMRTFIESIGRMLFWVTWPGLKLYMGRTERARILVVTDNQYILLIKNWYGSGEWSLPGGGIKSGEDPAITCVRELMEETTIDLDVDQVHPLGVQAYSHRGISFRCHYYTADSKEKLVGRPRMPEVLDYTWAPISSIAALSTSPEVEAALSARTALLQ